MQNTLITILLVTFFLLLVANVYFRVKAFRAFQKLTNNGVGLGRQHLFDPKLLEKEVLQRHPEHRDLILAHIRSMRLSFRISSLCMVVLTLCGGVLMFYRNQ